MATRIGDLMSTNIQTIEQSEDANEAYQLMKKHGIHHLPVVDGDAVVGILSMSDIRKLLFVSEFVNGKVDASTALQTFSVEEIMTKHVDSIDVNQLVNEAANMFMKHDFSCLPVVDNDDLVGIVTTTDLLKYYSTI